MRLDTANRSFLLLLGVALAPYLLLGVAGCAIVSVAAFRAGTEGTSGWGAATWLALAFLSVTAAGAILGLRSLWRQRRATAELARFVDEHRISVGGALATVTAEEGIERVEVIDVPEPVSLTYGIRRPSVVVSRGLLDAVSDDELRAVLVHERYHVRNLDPLKVVVARAVPAAFFFLPALRHLRGSYLAGRELAADQRAVHACGRRPLAGALFKVARASAPLSSLTAAAAIGGSELLEVRLAQLEDGHEPPLPTISSPVLASTVVAVVLMTLGLAATATVAGVPIPGGGGMGSSGPASLLGGLACGGLWLVAAGALYGGVGERRPATDLE